MDVWTVRREQRKGEVAVNGGSTVKREESNETETRGIDLKFSHMIFAKVSSKAAATKPYQLIELYTHLCCIPNSI